MPSNLTDTSSFDTVIGPQPTDVRNAAAVRSYLQTLANRTRFLFDRLTALADIAALKAIATPADGLVRHVKARGLYVFDASSAAAEALPFIVQPNSGSGRWIHALQGIAAQANGLATLDGSGKVPSAQLSNRIVSTHFETRNVTASVPATSTYFDVATATVTGCQAGDILIIDGYAACTTGASGCDFRIMALEGAVEQTFGQNGRIHGNLTVGSISLHGRWTVVTPGSVTAKLQAITAVGGSTVLGEASGPRCSIRVMHIRP